MKDEREKLVSSGVNADNLGEWTVSVAEIPDEEWAHTWKQYWHVQKISENIVYLSKLGRISG